MPTVQQLASRLKFQSEPLYPHRYGVKQVSRRDRPPEGVILNPSYRILAKGGKRMGEGFKRKNLGLVRIVTDDIEITLGMVLRNDEERQVRLCHCVDGRHGLFEIVAVDRQRIQAMQVLN